MAGCHDDYAAPTPCPSTRPVNPPPLPLSPSPSSSNDAGPVAGATGEIYRPGSRERAAIVIALLIGPGVIRDRRGLNDKISPRARARACESRVIKAGRLINKVNTRGTINSSESRFLSAQILLQIQIDDDHCAIIDTYRLRFFSHSSFHLPPRAPADILEARKQQAELRINHRPARIVINGSLRSRRARARARAARNSVRLIFYAINN